MDTSISDLLKSLSYKFEYGILDGESFWDKAYSIIVREIDLGNGLPSIKRAENLLIVGGVFYNKKYEDATIEKLYNPKLITKKNQDKWGKKYF